jgi:hypothetical protein
LRGADLHLSRRLLRHTLIHPPGAVADAQVRPDALLQFNSIGLDPYVDGPLLARCFAVL